jgi:hypothetical protein
MLAEIGVKVRLRTGSASKRDSAIACPLIVASLENKVPEDFMPGALAYAKPFAVSGTRIRVFAGRIFQDHRPDQALVLAHVLVHEIAHVLEGTDHHSQSGIMKANWDGADFARMRVRPLTFTNEDKDLILRGLGEKQVTDGATD